MKAAELRSQYPRLRAARPRMLQPTDLLEDSFAERDIPFEPAEYFEIPPIEHKIGKMVIPFVALDGRGMLIQNLPAFYAVTKRPDTAGFENAYGITRRSQQSHVIAEDLSLKRGIFTPYARTNTEVLIADMLNEAYRESYISDRIAHLGELAKEADTSEQLYPKQRDIVVEELSLAIDALQQRIG